MQTTTDQLDNFSHAVELGAAKPATSVKIRDLPFLLSGTFNHPQTAEPIPHYQGYFIGNFGNGSVVFETGFEGEERFWNCIGPYSSLDDDLADVIAKNRR